MMLVPTYIAPSRIEGVGVFAEAPIAAGMLIWRLDPDTDRLIRRLEVGAYPPHFQTFIERYSLRDGLRDSGGRAELVTPDADNPATRDLLRRRTQRIDTAYRQWSRRRDDVAALQDLQDAISDYMAETLTASGVDT